MPIAAWPDLAHRALSAISGDRRDRAGSPLEMAMNLCILSGRLSLNSLRCAQ